MLFIILFIILIGLVALVAWRLYVSYKDRKACEQWIEYLKNRKFTSTGENPFHYPRDQCKVLIKSIKILSTGENPFYKAPQSEFKNPLYQQPDSLM